MSSSDCQHRGHDLSSERDLPIGEFLIFQRSKNETNNSDKCVGVGGHRGPLGTATQGSRLSREADAGDWPDRHPVPPKEDSELKALDAQLKKLGSDYKLEELRKQRKPFDDAYTTGEKALRAAYEKE